MDIIVTTPKSEIETSRLEGETVEKEGGYWFRTFKFRPNVHPDDKIFFVEDGLIKGFGKIFAVEKLRSKVQCDTTDRYWGSEGGYIVKYNRWNWLKNPVRMKGFMGIRYVKNLEPDFQRLLQ